MLRNTLKEDILVFLINRYPKRIKKRDIERYFRIQDNERRDFYIAMKELQKEKVVKVSKGGHVLLKGGKSTIVGKFYYNPKGFGFVVSANNKKDVYFIAPDNIQNALHEDIVVATKLTKEQARKTEARIESIVYREIDTVTGTYMASETYGFVIPDNQKINMDIYVPQNLTMNAKSYDKVVCKILKYPKKSRNPVGEVVEVLGFEFEKGVDVLSVIKEFNLRDSFPAKVLGQVDKVASQISEGDILHRRDLRHLNIVTIDGEDSKDLDDAVSIKVLDNGNFELGVHIADVSYYVKENSRVDKEALERGVSVYLVDTVLPMLPRKLSDDLCSLNPNTDKLTLSVLMEIDHEGNVVSYDIFESIIRSKARLNYHEVTDFLTEKNPQFAQQYQLIAEDIRVMEKLARILMEKRDRRGNIDFDFPEAKIHLDEGGNVVDVCKYERGIANQIIEEFMIVCNETVSEVFHKKEIPFLYRTHENPREEKMRDFCEFIKPFGYVLEDNESPNPKQLQEILHGVKGKNEERAVNLLLLRCMQQARYTPVCKGHFGLATKFYSHFTSPIRRYPDLQIHRIIKEYLHGEITSARKEALEKIVTENAKLCSKHERIAERAEESLYQMKKVEFMRNQVGQCFDGIITSVVASGFTVTLENTVDGFVSVSKLRDDRYEFRKEGQVLVGVNSGTKISLGDCVRVRLDKVKAESREIFFSLIGNADGSEPLN